MSLTRVPTKLLKWNSGSFSGFFPGFVQLLGYGLSLNKQAMVIDPTLVHYCEFEVRVIRFDHVVIWQANRRCILRYGNYCFYTTGAFWGGNAGTAGRWSYFVICHTSPHRCRLANCNMQLPTLRCTFRKYLNNRFQELINRPEYVVSTILDCRYKLVPFP